MIFLFFFFSFLSYAQNRDSLYKKPETKSAASQVSEQKTPHNPKPHSQAFTNSNLPNYYVTQFEKSYNENPILLPAQNQNLINPHIHPGDLLKITILESLIAFTDSKTPIRAMIKSENLKGAILIGEASLDKSSHRITIQFQKLIEKSHNSQISQVQAVVLDQEGTLGLEGKIISHENKYFTAELISSLASGFVDASIDRSQNAIGNYTEKPGLDTAAKKALVTSMSKSADFYAEKLKTNTDYAILSGPIMASTLILDSSFITKQQ